MTRNGRHGALLPPEDDRRLPQAFTPSDRLVGLVESRLEDLGKEERALLELVAFGGTLGHAELVTLADPALADFLERRALLSSHTNGRRSELRLAHPLYGAVLRTGLPTTRAQTLARSLAETIEATGVRRQADALRVASWRLLAGGGRHEVMLAGAIAASRRGDYPFAERLARAAMERHAGFDAALLAARLASLQGRTTEAERELSALADQAADDTQRGLVAVARLDNSVTWTGTDELGILHEAEASISDPSWRDALYARRLGLILYNRGPRAAADSTAPLLEREEGGAFVFACITAAYSLSRLGRIEEALDVASRGHAAQLTGPEPLTGCGWWHVAMRCLALSYAGRLEEAEALAADHYGAALDERLAEAQAIFALLPAAIVAERGRVQTAARQAREALALSQRLGRPLMVRLCQLYNALALALGGRAHEAAGAIAAIDAHDLPAVLHDQVDLTQARAWTAAASGHLPEARRQLEKAARLGEDIGDLVGEAAALHGLARLGRARHVRDRLAAVAGQIEGDLARARLDHTEALAGHDAPGLEKVSQSFEAMGADLLAAEAAADAAVARWQAGELRAAVTAQRRASLLALRCEGACTPALQAVDVRSRLTTGEWESALMAATGHPSKQVATELCLSVRTVENHLQRCYEKLGISSRAELAEALGLGP